MARKTMFAREAANEFPLKRVSTFQYKTITSQFPLSMVEGT
jgi:hypothetical protein